MAKIQLGKRPKNFKRAITVKLPEGVDGRITVSYIYRTRTEFGKFLDDLLAQASVTLPSSTGDDVNVSMAMALAELRDQNADYILRVIDGWDLDEEFSHANVAQLCDELPGVALAIMAEYRSAVSEGRAGN